MNVFLVADPGKCIGCRTCEVACAVAHSDDDAIVSGTLDRSFFPRLRVIKTAQVSAPIQCRHCEDAPCANVCPNHAIRHWRDSIQVDGAACIGCKNCLMACPFGVMDLVPRVIEGERVLQAGLKVVVDGEARRKEYLEACKCDLCIDRPAGPACMEVCLNKAFTLVKAGDIGQRTKQKRRKCAEDLRGLDQQMTSRP
jgi:electron transport protein HydN